MKNIFSTQGNKLVVMATNAAKKMHNDTISGHHDIYGSLPEIRRDEDIAFGRLQSFVPNITEGEVLLSQNPTLANDLYEHDC